MKPEIQILEQHLPGYGSPPEWHVTAVCDNRILEHRRCGSERSLGVAIAELRAKWDKEWDENEFAAILEQSKLASPLCDICGKDTLKGLTSCVNKNFCQNCKHLIPEYQAQYKEEARQREERWKAEQVERDQRQHDEVKARITTAFHWRENWYWKRLSDGSVNLMHLHESGKYLSPDLTIPPNEWASIMASVSFDGETGDTWNAALLFHGSST